MKSFLREGGDTTVFVLETREKSLLTTKEHVLAFRSLYFLLLSLQGGTVRRPLEICDASTKFLVGDDRSFRRAPGLVLPVAGLFSLHFFDPLPFLRGLSLLHLPLLDCRSLDPCHEPWIAGMVQQGQVYS